jgi:uncharacterized protein
MIEMADVGQFGLAVSDSIIDEVLRVLSEHFQWPDERLRGAKYQMNAIARKVTPGEEVDVVKDDPTDNRILECAAAARSDYIVTGDSHLLRVKTFRDIPILKVANFLELLGKGRGR